MYAWPEGRVVKLFKAGFPAEAIELELHHSRLAHECGLPTPRPEGLVSLQGRTGIVFERCDGPTLYDLLVQERHSPEALANLFFDLQQQIYRCAAPALQPLSVLIARRIRSLPGVPPETVRSALALLDAAPDVPTLCHGDFHPINVVVTAERAVIIDWFDAARGDPAMDTVRTLLYLQHARPGALRPAVRTAFLHAYVQRCREAWSERVADLERWGLPVALSRLASVSDESERQSLTRFVASLA